MLVRVCLLQNHEQNRTDNKCAKYNELSSSTKFNKVFSFFSFLSRQCLSAVLEKYNSHLNCLMKTQVFTHYSLHQFNKHVEASTALPKVFQFLKQRVREQDWHLRDVCSKCYEPMCMQVMSEWMANLTPCKCICFTIQEAMRKE